MKDFNDCDKAAGEKPDFVSFSDFAFCLDKFDGFLEEEVRYHFLSSDG